jgi:hypothetical protein
MKDVPFGSALVAFKGKLAKRKLELDRRKNKGG